jgi:hypothetical protein
MDNLDRTLHEIILNRTQLHAHQLYDCNSLFLEVGQVYVLRLVDQNRFGVVASKEGD